MIHEGGFLKGSRNCFSQYGEHFTNLGFAVMSIDYRLLTEGGAYPEAVKDCIQALRWLKAHSALYKIDKNNISLMGCSCGHDRPCGGVTGHSTGRP
jgi:acetyl esterase/lipase